ncbi:hypothetical protein [Sphingomonas sp.]|nr:hypothetical protein [Sphingomonas sp.]HWK35358.1 hypothetical protein [Sphingomonas sp.]
MKLLIVIAVIVFATVADLLFGGGHHVRAVLDWLHGFAGGSAGATWR